MYDREMVNSACGQDYRLWSRSPHHEVCNIVQPAILPVPIRERARASRFVSHIPPFALRMIRRIGRDIFQRAKQYMAMSVQGEMTRICGK